MPPKPPQPPPKPYFFYGHRKPSQNRPTVYGGFFSNRYSLKDPDPKSHSNQPEPIFDLQKWDPHYLPSQNRPPRSQTPSLSQSQRLSPIARFIVDSFRKSQSGWGPEVVTQLNKLRRVTPDLVAEVLKVENNPVLASRFFHWAGKQKGYRHTFASYNALTYCLNRNKLFRAADQVPELMDSQGKPPTEKQFEILIRMHADCGRGLRVNYVYRKMKKFGLVPSVFLYNRIMDALVKTNHLDLALSVYDDFKAHELVEESITYMILIKGLCKEGRFEEMFELLGKMRDNLCKPDVFAYTAMIKVLVSEGNLDACCRVWEEMRKDMVEPDVMAYVTLIMVWVVQGNERKEILIDRAIYGVLVDGFVGKGKVGKACDLLKDLMDSG